MLLHRVSWRINETFANICRNYILYLRRNFGSNIHVVFDGYGNSSTKTAERNRRNSKHTSTEIFFTKDMSLTIKQEDFLANVSNKERLIELLKTVLLEEGIHVYQAEDDADVLIVRTAISMEHDKTVIVAEDTDVLVLLSALCPVERNILFLKPTKGSAAKKIYSSKSFGSNASFSPECLLFVHAYTGCDTTSSFYGRSKTKFAKAFEKDKEIQEIAKIFCAPNQSVDAISKAGEKCFFLWCKAPKKVTNINELRYKYFLKAVTKNKTVKLSSLPPTKDALIEHSKRVYHQVQLWKGVKLPIEEWGWNRDNLQPIMMNEPPAPESLLQMIFCNCKTGCGSACSCRKSGLYCTAACGHCSGHDCSNCAPILDLDDDNSVENTNSNEYLDSVENPHSVEDSCDLDFDDDEETM